MSYEFITGETYRMPTHFGPATGPRRGPEGRRFDCKTSPKMTAITVRFLSSAPQLQALMPPGFQLRGEPVVTVTASYMTEIQWLAGRGYNMLGVLIPAIFQGKIDRVEGNLLTVLWENMTDPIITGREELGFSKIFAELPDPLTTGDQTHCHAAWMGYKFMDMDVREITPMTSEQIHTSLAQPPGDGILHYKYSPRTGQWGQADAQYAVLTPAAVPNRVVQSMSRGNGIVKFHHARWEDMPTQYMIANALADLEQREWRGATITQTVGGKDLSDQRILH